MREELHRNALALKADAIKPENVLFAARFRPSFSPEIFPAGAVMGLKESHIRCAVACRQTE